MLQAQIIPVTPYQQNCTLVWCTDTNEAAFIDPGGDLHLLKDALEKQRLKLTKVLLTHGHLDHASGTMALAEEFNVPVIGPEKEDKFWLDAIPDACARSGFPPAKAVVPTQWLNDGDRVRVGQVEFQVLHCPGHTPGHVVFFEPTAKVAWVGDVLFQGSIGRTDFPRGDHDTLVRSIREKLWPLGDEVRFVPGHGPMSTFGNERASNPFVADARYR